MSNGAFWQSILGSAAPISSAGKNPDEFRAQDNPMAWLTGKDSDFDATQGTSYQAGPGRVGKTLLAGTPAEPRTGVSNPPDGGAVRSISVAPASNQTPPSETPSGPPAVPASVQPSGNSQTPMSRFARQAIQGQLTAAQSAASAAGGPQPDMAGLEAKRTAAAAAAPQLNDPNHPEYKPSIGSRFARGLEGVGLGLAQGGLRGAIAGGIAPQVTGLAGYRDPSSAFNRANAANQKQVGDLDQQLSAAKDLTQAQGEAVKNQTGIASAFGGVGKDIVAQQNADSKQTQIEQLAAKAGQKPVKDADGNITGFEDDTDSEAYKGRKVLDDVRQTQQELNEAKAATEKSKNDPNSPAYKLAVAKERTAQQNASAASTRAAAYMGNYLQGAFNTDLHGNTLPGAPQIGNGGGNRTVVGTKNAATAIKNQANAAQFNDVHGALDQLEQSAKALVKSGGKLNDPVVAAALAHPKGTLGQWIQGEVAKGNMTPQQRDYVIANAGAHENIQAMRKAAGGTATDSSVAKLDALIPGASTPDIDYFLRQTGQIRSTANRLGQGVTTATGGLDVRRGDSSSSSSAPPSGKEVSLSAARSLPGNKGKSDDEIRKDIEAHGHRVKE